MSALPRMKPIVPWWQLAALLALCAGGIYFLLPDDPKLLDNLVSDRNSREARRLLNRISPEERARHPERYRLLELQLARLELPPSSDAPARAAALEKLTQQAAADWRASRYAEPILLELVALLPEARNLEPLSKLLAPHLPGAPEKQRAVLVDAFTRAALANAQPALAAEVFAQRSPPAARTPEQALELARLWQLAGRPADALEALGDHRGAEVNARRITLLRALNRNREALELLRASPATSNDPAIASARTHDLIDIALAAGAPAEAVPALQQLAAANPNDLDTVRRLRSVFVAAGQPANAIGHARHAAELSQRDSADLLELARILEWSGRPSDAFDVWAELADRNQPGALERLIALNPGLFRDADLARALEQSLARTPHDDYLLALARLQVELGNYGVARATFERYLALHPDPAVTLELTRILRENFDFAAAETWLRRALAARPKDIQARRELGELLVLQGRHADALTVYAELVEFSDAEEVIGPFTRLAEALGRFDEFARGLERRIRAAAMPSERDFILLAYAYELAANPAGRRATIEEGLRRHPGSDDLRLQLAYLLSSERNYRTAQQTLATHSRLRSDIGAVTLYLDLLRLSNDTAAERAFLAQPLDPNIAAEEPVLERLARVHEAARDFAAAERIWRDLYARNPDNVSRAADLARLLLARDKPLEAQQLLAPFLREPTPPALKLAAEISEAAGDHRAAEKYQLAYLAAVRDAPATDWGALGDIRLSRGDRDGAKRAYTEALRRMHAALSAKGPAP